MGIFNPRNNGNKGVWRIFDKRVKYVGKVVISRDIANFQGGKSTFGPIYLKISAMEGKIFWAFLFFGAMTMVSGGFLVQHLQWCRGGFLVNAPIM